MVDLAAPVKAVVGDRTAKELTARLGVHTVEDLLRHYPRRYYERGELTDLSGLRAGEQATVQATVASVSGRQLRAKLHKLDVVVTDGHRRLTLTFFNKRYLDKMLPPGTEALFAGTVEAFRGRLTLTNPEVSVGDDADSFAGGLLPVYPATAKLASWAVAKSVRHRARPRRPGPRPAAGGRARAARAPAARAGPATWCTGRPTARTYGGRSSGCASTRPSCCRSCSPGGAPRPPSAARDGAGARARRACWPRSTSGCPSA